MRESFDRKNKDSVEHEPDQLIIEVGCGRSPHPLYGATDEYIRRMSQDEHVRYVGVDIDEEDLGQAKKTVARRSEGLGLPDQRIDFVRAQGRRLPFDNESAIEVILRNVLGDPDIFAHHKLQILNEAARVLKPDGVLKIIEQYTPAVALGGYLTQHISNMTKGDFTVITPEELSQDELLSDAKLHQLEVADEETFITRLRKRGVPTER